MSLFENHTSFSCFPALLLFIWELVQGHNFNESCEVFLRSEKIAIMLY